MAAVMGVKPESLTRWAVRQEIDTSVSTQKQGRPEVISPFVRRLIRTRYLQSYKQWGPRILAAWARREGWGTYSPETIARVIEDIRETKKPKEKPRRYEMTAPNVMWSEDGTDFRENGRKKELLILQDECSRYKIHTRLTHGPANSQDVHDYLQEAFDKHGPPLILKHDGDSIFHEEKVEKLLADHHVVSLTSPPHYPPFNGKMERAMRDVKSYVRAMKTYSPGHPLQTMIDDAMEDLNDARPRPVLGGKTSKEVFENTRKTLPSRKKFYQEVMKVEEQLLDDAASRKQKREARRTAVELVLYRYEMMKEYCDVSTYFKAKTWTF